MSPPGRGMSCAKKTKARTGCKTCKIRRVKCDEERPACLRCFKFGMVCDGYETIEQRPKISSQLPPRKILPRISRGSESPSPSRTGLFFKASFPDDQEYKYFLYFQEETVLELSGPYETNLWNHVVLQACQIEPSLSRLTASIGALSKALRLRDLNQNEEANSHQQYALQKYGRALKDIQKVISARKQQDSARIALITSLLIYCFENLHGDLESAVKHMRSALRLMHKQLAHTSCHYRHLQNTSPTPALEDALVVALVRLDSDLLATIDSSDMKSNTSYYVRPSILDIDYSENTYNVPYRFQTINEARTYLEQFQFRAFPSLAHEFGVHIKNPPGTVNETARELYASMSSQLRQWRAAFAPLYAQACASTESRNLIAAITLRVKALSAEFLAKCICARGTNPSYLFMFEDREIVNLSRRVIADPGFHRRFAFDCGILPALFIIVCISPDMRVREEALRVLRQTVPRREGSWDSLTLVKAGETILQVEHSRRAAAGDRGHE